MLNETELLKAFEEYQGYKLEDWDIMGNFEFEAFCAGYKLRDKEL